MGSLSFKETAQLFDQYVIANYARFPVSLVRGEGSYVWDSEGNRYLDFFPGWGCNLLGHCPGPVVEAVREQLGTLIHVPNTWYTEAPGPMGQGPRPSAASAARRSSAIPAPRPTRRPSSWSACTPPKRRYKIITFEGGFHGRTLGSTTATAQPKYHEGLGPLMAGFVYAPFGDLDAVARLIDDETAAIMIEPIQGEGGVRHPARRISGRPAETGRRARDAVDLRRGADRLRPDRPLVRLPAFRRHARRDDAGQGDLRRPGRRGDADHARDRPEPAAGHARRPRSAAIPIAAGRRRRRASR